MFGFRLFYVGYVRGSRVIVIVLGFGLVRGLGRYSSCLDAKGVLASVVGECEEIERERGRWKAGVVGWWSVFDEFLRVSVMARSNTLGREVCLLEEGIFNIAVI